MPPPWVNLRGRLPGRETYQRRDISQVKYIVVHHTGVDVDNSAKEIASYHVNAEGWPGIGYHFLVHPDGTIDYVGDITTTRYNVATLNEFCIGICVVGDFTLRQPTPKALRSTSLLVNWLRADPVPQAIVVGHRDVAVEGWRTACPGDTWLTWRNKL